MPFCVIKLTGAKPLFSSADRPAWGQLLNFGPNRSIHDRDPAGKSSERHPDGERCVIPKIPNTSTIVSHCIGPRYFLRHHVWGRGPDVVLVPHRDPLGADHVHEAPGP